MLNSRENVNALLEKYRNNACTEAEQQVLMEWLDEQAAKGNSYVFGSEQEKEATRQRMLKALAIASPKKTAYLKSARVWYAAAAVIAVVVLSGYLLTKPSLVQLTTTTAQVRKQLLPDGSTIWLNDNAAVSYRTDFAHNRTLLLQKGEVFLDVQKDAAHPFTIQSGDVVTTVLGTSFSVKRIGEQQRDIKISVVSGKVMVGKASDTLAFLLPGQRLKYDAAGNRAVIDTVLNGEANGWINQSLLMQSASLQEVAQWLHDHYTITVINHKPADTGSYYLQVDTKAGLADVLKILNRLGMKHQVRFIQQAQTVVIQ